ncbi:MAG TPA: hypothetical protein VFE44_05305 [Thermoanaerobaculia bacterium]|nr:hypothetical protein [Thermoanaerobaculia bacterium]
MRRPARILVGGLAVWSVAALAWESYRAARPRWSDPPQFRRGVWAWQFRTPPVENLERLLRAAEGHLPVGSRVAFEPPSISPELRFLWAAYLLPRHDVVLASDLAGRVETVDYWLVQRARSDDARLELVAELPGGALYRVRR